MGLQHELHRFPEIAGKLLWAIGRELLTDGWRLDQKRSSYNSWYVWKPGSWREYHFRWRGGNKIVVMSRYSGGTKVMEIVEDGDVLRFIVRVRKNERTQAQRLAKAA